MIFAFHNSGDSVSISSHPFSNFSYEGMGNLGSATPRYTFTWDIEQVLKHDKLALNLLSLKFAMLLVLAAPNSGLEIKSLDKKYLARSEAI